MSSMVYFKLENVKTNQTADLQVFVPTNAPVGKSLPMGFKITPTENSPTIWQPSESWIIRDIIQDGTITAGAIQLMESTQPTATIALLTAQGPENPGRAKFAVPFIEGKMYSIQVIAQVANS